MRQSKETKKECGYIILPLLVKEGESLEDIKSSDRFSDVAKIITSLSTQDERIKEELKQTKNTKRNTGTRIIIEEDLVELLDVELSQIQASLKTVIWQRVGKANWTPFEEARKFALRLGLQSQNEWHQYAKSTDRPLDIPTNPRVIYMNKGWVGFGDWLGTGIIASRDFKYPPFEEARAFVHKLKLRSYSEWYEWKTSKKRPAYISGNPNRTYKDKGWINFPDWLGNDGISKNHVYRSFVDARAYVRSLSLKNLKEWSETRKQPSFPKDIPKNPAINYKDKGWINLGDWLGTFTINPKNREYASYEHASKFAQSLNLKSLLEWRKYLKENKLPENIPSNPGTVYKDKGWRGFGDFLGTGNLKNGAINYLSFEQAKQFVQGLGLNSASDWRIFSKSGARPNNIPANPDKKYKNSGWMSWQDFLGYQEINKFNYEEAVEYISKFKFSSSTEFFKEARAGKLVEAMPRSPDVFYKHHGWKGWHTFLGINVQIIRNRNYFSYAEAKKILKPHKVRSSRTWKEFRKSPAFPEKIPADPPTFYKNYGWISWQDFLSREEYLESRLEQALSSCRS